MGLHNGSTMNKTFHLTLTLAACALAAGCSMLGIDKPAAQAAAPASTIPADALNPAVTPQTIGQTICTDGYAARTRASQVTLQGIKRRLVEESAMTDGTLYELQERVPLELGGHPGNVRNFVLQPWDAHASNRPRQRLVATLQRMVCTGQVSLRDAQEAMFVDWRAAYPRYVKE